MKYKLKDYSQFLNEEVDLSKGNKGIPSDFIRNADTEAQKNLGLKIDRPGPSNIGSLISQSTSFITTQGLDTSSPTYNIDLENRYKKLEELAKDVIIDQFGAILETSVKPVELKIKLVRSVIDELPKLGDKAETSDDKPEYEEEEQEEQEEKEIQAQEEYEEEQEEQAQEEDDFFSFFDDESQEEEEEHEEEDIEDATNKDVAFAIDKTKILNMITQGAGKATKDIIKSSEAVANGLRGIFGDSYETILDIWSKTSDEADKLDWQIPVGQKQQMFKNAPGGIAGAVDLAWESLNNKQFKLKLLKENTEFDKIVIRAYGIDFPMLIHETVKGIYMLLQSAAIKSNPELAEEIKKATSSYRDESEDFRYGNLAYAMFRDFINNFDDANKYSNINIKEKIYAKLSADEKRGGMFSDGEFLEITNSIFSSFDKVEENGKIKFNINADRFNESIAKEKLEDIIKEIVENEDRYQEELRDYEEALRKWELEQQFGTSDYDDDKDRDEDEEHPEPGKEEGQSEIDRLTRQTAEREQDLSNLTPREIQELIDDALDRGDYDEVRKLSPFLGESANIYLKEMNRIFELKNYERK
jgi:hypothetical protein